MASPRIASLVLPGNFGNFGILQQIVSSLLIDALMYLAQIVHGRLFILRRVSDSRSQDGVAKEFFGLRIRRITITQPEMMYGFESLDDGKGDAADEADRSQYS